MKNHCLQVPPILKITSTVYVQCPNNLIDFSKKLVAAQTSNRLSLKSRRLTSEDFQGAFSDIDCDRRALSFSQLTGNNGACN